MTLCVAWIRRAGRCEELMMASDSRLNGGGNFDCAPKLFPLKRGDCALACAGDTSYSFPLVNQMQSSIDLNIKSYTRAQDVSQLVHYFEDMMNVCLSEYKDPDEYDKEKGPDFQMILAGYSVNRQEFMAKSYQFDHYKKKMKRTSQNTLMGNLLVVIGDKDVVNKYRRNLFLRLEEEGVRYNTGFNMQPLDVLYDFINDKHYNTIAGHPQMIKITRFLSIQPYGIKEHMADGTTIISYMGRPLMNYETFPYPIYDINSKETSYMKEIAKDYTRNKQDINQLKQFN